MIKKTHPTEKVLTGPQWLADAMNGQVSPNGQCTIEIFYDADGLPIIGTGIIGHPDWEGFGETIINGKPILEWFTEIPFTYWDENE
jgi:hypothetical protein